MRDKELKLEDGEAVRSLHTLGVVGTLKRQKKREVGALVILPVLISLT